VFQILTGGTPVYTNPILNVDSYKTSHFLQYPPGAEIVSSYIESRGGRYADSVFFGLPKTLHSVWEASCFKTLTATLCSLL